MQLREQTHPNPFHFFAHSSQWRWFTHFFLERAVAIDVRYDDNDDFQQTSHRRTKRSSSYKREGIFLLHISRRRHDQRFGFHFHTALFVCPSSLRLEKVLGPHPSRGSDFNGWDVSSAFAHPFSSSGSLFFQQCTITIFSAISTVEAHSLARKTQSLNLKEAGLASRNGGDTGSKGGYLPAWEEEDTGVLNFFWLFFFLYKNSHFTTSFGFSTLVVIVQP